MRTAFDFPKLNEPVDIASLPEGNGNSIELHRSDPNEWFARRFPKVHKKHGSALQIKEDRHGKPYVADISEDFFAGTLSGDGSPQAPTVYVTAEGRFYEYNPETGLYMDQTEHLLAARLSPILLLCAQEAGKEVNAGNLIYRFRKTAALRGVLQRAKGLLAVPPQTSVLVR